MGDGYGDATLQRTQRLLTWLLLRQLVLLVDPYPLAQFLVLLLQLLEFHLLHFLLTAPIILLVVLEEVVGVDLPYLADVCAAGAARVRLVQRHKISDVLELDAGPLHWFGRRGQPLLP